MMPGMRELANHVLAVAQSNGLSVNNLQLQKVMFFSLGLHLVEKGTDQLAQETYDMPFKKWRLGPAVESIYYTFNKYGLSPIEDKGVYCHVYAPWDEWIRLLLRVNPCVLIQIACSMAAWAKYENDIRNRRFVWPYTLDEIKSDFEEWFEGAQPRSL